MKKPNKGVVVIDFAMWDRTDETMFVFVLNPWCREEKSVVKSVVVTFDGEDCPRKLKDISRSFIVPIATGMVKNPVEVDEFRFRNTRTGRTEGKLSRNE